MVNIGGNNQYGGKLGKCSVLDDRSQRNWLIIRRGYKVLALDDLALKKLFEQFNREKDGAGLTVDEQLARLHALGCSMRFRIIQSHLRCIMC